MNPTPDSRDPTRDRNPLESPTNASNDSSLSDSSQSPPTKSPAIANRELSPLPTAATGDEPTRAATSEDTSAPARATSLPLPFENAATEIADQVNLAPAPPALPQLLPIPDDARPRAQTRPRQPAPTKASPGLIAACVAMGVFLLVVIALAPRRYTGAFGVGAIIGQILGAFAIWPLIVIGLFSIGRRFRNSYSRAVICLALWGLFSVAPLQQIAVKRQLGFSPFDVQSLLANAGVEKPTASSDSSVPDEPDSADADTTIAPRNTTALPAQPLAFDFSPGSDKRLVELITHAQEERYHQVVADYARACTMRPHDPTLALERVLFIEHFVDSDVTTMSSAAEDLEDAIAHLDRRFPNRPETILYHLERMWGEDSETEAAKHASLVTAWSASDAARYWLVRAHAADYLDEAANAIQFARRSFNLAPTVDAGLVLARNLLAEDRAEESRPILTHAVFASATPWQKNQRMHCLFQAGVHEQALALYHELDREFPAMTRDADVATRLAAAGQLDLAREIFANLTVTEWNADIVHRQRFEFELEHGSPEQALAAYRAWRDRGWYVDPFFRERAKLLIRDPSLPWNGDDALSAGTFLLLIGGGLLLPGLLLVPAHYWSLLRARRGKAGGWLEARWGLREAWLAFGVLLAIELFATWIWLPEDLLSWFAESETETVTGSEIPLRAQLLGWFVAAALVIVLFSRARAWRFVGGGVWRFWKSLGMGLGGALTLRLAVLLSIVIWPAAFANQLALAPAAELAANILQQWGALALIGIAAILVPILEETLCRGVLLQGIGKHLPFGWANAAQALVFAAGHFNLALTPFYFLFGLLAGFLTRRSGGLLAAIVMHGSNNLIVCLSLMRLDRLGLL